MTARLSDEALADLAEAARSNQERFAATVRSSRNTNALAALVAEVQASRRLLGRALASCGHDNGCHYGVEGGPCTCLRADIRAHLADGGGNG